MTRNFIALDIGGSGGRSFLGSFDGNSLSVTSSGRADLRYTHLRGTWYWDVLGFMEGVYSNLSYISSLGLDSIDGIGIDTMGVNFGLLDKNGELLANPLYSRVPQNSEVNDYVYKQVEADRLFNITGQQISKLNSLYFLAMLKKAGSPLLEAADRFLMLPDLINYWLSGQAVSEYTIASTSYLIDAGTRKWSREIIDRMGFSYEMFPEIVSPGSAVGNLLPEIQRKTGLGDVPVVATASHDTSAALAFVPIESENSAYISSGTWGMLGTDLDEPLINECSRVNSFANEGAVFGKIKFLYNSVSLWILKECKKTWNKTDPSLDWPDIIELAEKAGPFKGFIDPRDPEFLVSGEMPGSIVKRLTETGQDAPGTVGEFARIIFESIALKFRYVFDGLTECLGRRPEVLHIVGGGGKNDFLNQLISDAIGVPVKAGPYNATVLGNILMQMKASGDIGSRSEGVELVKRSCTLKEYYPVNHAAVNEQFERFREVLELRQRKV